MATFTMTQDDLDNILSRINQARSTPLIMLQCGMPPSPQDVANSCWQALGYKMGFDWRSVQPHSSGNQLMFTANPKDVA